MSVGKKWQQWQAVAVSRVTCEVLWTPNRAEAGIAFFPSFYGK